MSERVAKAFENAWKRVEKRRWIYGKLGKLAENGQYVFDVPGRPLFVWVTIRVANGAQTTVPARNDAGVEHAPRLNVRMLLEDGDYVIHGRTNKSSLGQNPSTPNTGVLPHEHIEYATTFLELNDAPDSYAGAAGKVVRVAVSEGGLEFGDASNIDAFTDLSDVPATYVGQSEKFVRVNTGETALEFVAPSEVGIGEIPKLQQGFNTTVANTESTSAYATKGNIVTPTKDMHLHALCYVGTTVANGVYKAYVVTYDGSNIITAITASDSYTVPAAGEDLSIKRHWLFFATPVALTAGTTYALMVGRTDGTDTYVLPMESSAAVRTPFGNRTDEATAGIRVAKAAPAVSDTLDIPSGNSFSMGYLWAYDDQALQVFVDISQLIVDDEYVQDLVALMLADNSSINITYNDTLGTIDIAVIDEYIQDIVGLMVSGNTETGIAVTYDDTLGKLNFDAQTASDARYAQLAAANAWSVAQTFPTSSGLGSGSGSASFLLNGGAGAVRDYIFQSGGVYRWILRTNSAAESGSNAGSDFQIVSRDDAGALLRNDLTITRSNGNWTFGGSLQSPTIVTPTIASFASAQHDHTNAAGGGQLGTDALANDAVTNAKLANMANATVKGRTTAGTGDPEDLTMAQLVALIEAQALYALLAGRSGGQTLKGGTGAGDDLTLQSTSHATPGNIFFGASGVGGTYDEVNDRWGFGITDPTVAFEVSRPDGQPAAMRFISHGTSLNTGIGIYTPRGTRATPSVNLSGDTLGLISLGGWDGNLSNGAQIRAVAAADWGSGGDTSDSPANLIFATTPDGSGTLTDRLQINSDGTINYLLTQRVSSQFNKTNNTLADITGLSIPLPASGNFRFKARIWVTPAAVAGVGSKVGVGYTGTTSTFRAHSIMWTSTAGGGTFAYAAAVGALGSSGGSSSASNEYYDIEGYLVSTGAGNLTIQFAQFTTNASQSSVLTGSTLEVWQVT